MDEKSKDIAIIDMACRIPGKSNNSHVFWVFLISAGDGIIDRLADRWGAERYFDAGQNAPNKMHVKRGGLADVINQFDPQLFGIATIEAPPIDPQHCWSFELRLEQFESAGLKTCGFKDSNTAVYIRQFMQDYEQIRPHQLAQSNEKSHAAYIAQPAVFSTQVPLAALLVQWETKLHYHYVVDHSAGEVAAAYVVGALNFEDAVKMFYHRSRLVHTIEGAGKMPEVAPTEAVLQPYLQGHENQISIAAIISEDSLMLSGNAAIISATAEQLKAESIFFALSECRCALPLPLMDRLELPLIEALQSIQVQLPHNPL